MSNCHCHIRCNTIWCDGRIDMPFQSQGQLWFQGFWDVSFNLQCLSLSGFKNSCTPGETGSNFVGIDTLQTLNNEEQAHFLSSQQHFSPEEHEYQALEPGHQPQSYLESSPEFYAGNTLLESKYHPHNYVKNYVRGKFSPVRLFSVITFQYCYTMNVLSSSFSASIDESNENRHLDTFIGDVRC